MIVGLTGKKRAGKDTVAAVLVEEFGFERIAFADPMKEAALALDPWIDVTAPPCPRFIRLSEVLRDFGGWETAKEFPEVRRTLQRLGTQLGREVLGEDLWVDAGIAQMREPGQNYVVTDCRFPNEADAIRELGGEIVRVIRPSLVSDDTHASETAMDDYDVDASLLNESTIEALQQATRSMMRFL